MLIKNGQQPTGSFPRYGGFVQFDVRQGMSGENIVSVREGLARLAPEPGGILVLPELWACGFDYANLERGAAVTTEMLEGLQELAGAYGVLLAGSMIEKIEANGEKAYFNALFIVGENGSVGQYRKQRLFAPMAEDRHFSAGDNPVPIATPLGIVAGLVCYDLRFPELLRCQSAQGAQLAVVSAQWPSERTENWRALLRARALENQMYIIACNRCGTTGQTAFAGHSMIVDPDGNILAEAAEEPDERLAALDIDHHRALRSRFNTIGPSPYAFADQDKITDLAGLLARVAIWRQLGRRIVFTNGCFDLLHPGHVTYLEKARRCGDCLVVGLNSDASVRAIKGPERPVNNENDRARVLAALGAVDAVVLFEQETPLELIKAVLPDVLVKGADWPVEKIVGAKEVMAAGGEVVTIPFVGEHSTTGIIGKIR